MEKKVLVVGEDQKACQLYVSYFPSRGYSPVRATSNQDVLDILGRERIDLIVLESKEPTAFGEVVMNKMSQHPEWKEIPIIIASTASRPTGQHRKMDRTFKGKLRFGFFQRPGRLEEVGDMIGQILAH